MDNFLARFVLPLVAGGTVEVGFPYGPKQHSKLALDLGVTRDLVSARLAKATASPKIGVVAKQISLHRQRVSQALLPGAAVADFDEPSLRLCVALHTLLALEHPTWRPSQKRRQEAIAYATDLAGLGAPESAEAAVHRYSLLARLADLQRNEQEVRHWLGSQTFVGRPPPKRLLMWPRVRRVNVLHRARTWLRDVGIAQDARRLWEAINQACPLMEALHPDRLDPPVSWIRLVSVLRFAPLARAVAGRLLGQGLDKVGEPLALALFQLSLLKDDALNIDGIHTIAFGIQFLSHLYWLHMLHEAPGQPGPAFLTLLAEAVWEPTLVYPADMVLGAGGMVADFEARLLAQRQRILRSDALEQQARAAVTQARRALSQAPSQVLRASGL